MPYGLTRGGRGGLVVVYRLLTTVAISHLVQLRTTPWVGLIDSAKRGGQAQPAGDGIHLAIHFLGPLLPWG